MKALKSLLRSSLLIALTLLFAQACGPRKHVESPSAQLFAQYVKAYTGGIVGEGTDIRIDLTEDVAAESQFTEGLFALPVLIF